MAEEWGTVIVKASEEIATVFEAGNHRVALKQLAEFAELDGAVVEKSIAAVDEVSKVGPYAVLTYHCSEWIDLSVAFVSRGANIEYYGRHGDEYGTLSFYALNENGEKLGFQFDEDGDEWDYPDFAERTAAKLKQWHEALPQTLRDALPDFASIDEFDFG